MTACTVQVVTDNDKFFQSLHFVDEENLCSNSRANVFARLVDKLFASKKIAPPPQPWLIFTQCLEVKSDILERQNDFIVIYCQDDYAALYKHAEQAGYSGAYIVCVETKDEQHQVQKMFARFSSVDVVLKDSCSKTEDLSYILLGSILKRALREAGFME